MLPSLLSFNDFCCQNIYGGRSSDDTQVKVERRKKFSSMTQTQKWIIDALKHFRCWLWEDFLFLADIFEIQLAEKELWETKCYERGQLDGVKWCSSKILKN